MTPIPTPEALYRRLRPEPEKGETDGGFVNIDWTVWSETLDEIIRLASNPRTEIAAAFTLLGMMPKVMDTTEVKLAFNPCDKEEWPAVVVKWYPPHKTGSDWHCRIETGPTPAAALYAAMGAAIDLRRESDG